MAALIIRSHHEGAVNFPLSGTSVSAGRRPTNDLVLADPTVSGFHCLFDFDGKQWWVRDLMSRSGTMVNGSRIESTTKLVPADTIRLGRTVMEFSDETVQEDEHDASLRTVFVARPGAQVISRIPSLARRDDFPSWQLSDQEQVAQDYERLRLAHLLSQAIGMEREEDPMVGKILDVLMEFFTVDRGVVLLIDARTGELVPRKAKARIGIPEGVVEVPQSILTEVQNSKQAVLCADATSDVRFEGAQSVHLQGIHSSMSVPLVDTDEEILGIIYLDSLSLAGLFTEKDLHVLTSAAGQAATAIQNIRLADRLAREATARERFHRLLPPSLVERAMSGELAIEKGGVDREIAVFFSDIRGFTAMSERMGAGEVVTLLNDYFERMVDIVFRHEGTLDKFMGDGMMVLFGAPALQDDPCGRAVACASDMQLELRRWNQERRSAGLNEVYVGMGLDYGPLVVGYIGSERALNYTAIGDRVNRAARLCSKAAPGQILVSEAVRTRVEEASFRDLGQIELKGLSAPLAYYEVQATNYETLSATAAPGEESFELVIED